jgi:hypothetical protein
LKKKACGAIKKVYIEALLKEYLIIYVHSYRTFLCAGGVAERF